MIGRSHPHPGRQDNAADLAADSHPPGAEARAQRRATVMPLIWAGLGVIAVLIFVAALWLHSGGKAPPPSGPAPAAVGGAVAKP